MLFPAAHRHREAVAEAARGALNRRDGAEGDGSLDLARRKRNAAITLLRLGRPDEVEATLSMTKDPTARTMVILEMRRISALRPLSCST